MGVPPQNDPDREAEPIDEGWTAPTRTHNDQTTAGLTPRGLSPTGLAEGTDQILAELQRRDAVADNEQAKAGMGVVAARPDAGVTLLEPDNDMVRDEKEPVLAQPERSPLDFVMRELEPAAPRRTPASNESSRFVVSLMGDQPLPRVETESPVITAMEPVLRRGRQRTRIAAGALAATVALGTAGAVMLTRGDEAPQAAASEAAKVNESPTPTNVATVAPTPSNIATPTAPSENEVLAPKAPAAADVPPEPSSEPTPPAKLAIATAKPAKTLSTSSKPATAKKTVALKDPTAKKPSAAKTPSTAKKPAKKTTTAKVTTAKKPSTAKKSSTEKKPETKK